MSSVRAGVHSCLRWIGNDQHWRRRLAQYPIGCGTKHQPVKSSPAMRSHDDDFHVFCLSKRKNAVRGISLLNREVRLNLIARMLLDEFLQPFFATFINGL